jgi:potassium efflux system protein
VTAFGPTVRALFALAAMALLLGVGAVRAQDAAQDELGVEAIRKRLAAAEAGSEGDAAVRARVVENYKAALADAEVAAEMRAETARIRKRLPDAPGEIQRLERQLRDLQNYRLPPPPDATLPASSLEEIDASARADAEAARLAAAELDRQFNEAVSRPLDIRKQQATLRRELAELEARLDALASEGTAPAVTESERILLRTRIESRQARLERLEQELVYQPSLVRLLQLRRDAAHLVLDARTAELKQATAALEKRRGEDVAKAREQAARAKANSTAAGDPVAALTAATSERNAQLAETGLAINRSLLELSQHRARIAEIEQQLREARRRTSAGVASPDLARDLVQQVRDLPARADQFAQQSAERTATLALVSQQQAEVARARQALVDLDAATQQSLAAVDPGVPADQRQALARDARRELAAQRAALDRLEAQLATYAQTLRDTEEIEAELVARAREVRDEMVRLLYWVPVAPLGAETLADLPQGAAWLLSVEHWRGAWRAFRQSATRNALAVLTAALVLGALFTIRRRLKTQLERLAPRNIGYYRYGIRDTFAALGITLLLALPVPLAVWIAGRLLIGAPGVPPFAEGLGFALRSVAVPLILVLPLIRLLDERGVGINHFGWNRDEALHTRRMLKRLLAAIVPLGFLAALASATAPEAVRQSVGRLAFIVLMLVIAFYWSRVMVPALSLLRLGKERDTGIGVRAMRTVLSRGMVIVPLVLAAVSAIGFFFVAWRLWQLTGATLALIVAGGILYELLSLFMALQRRKLAELEAQATETAAASAASLEGAALVHEPTIDVDTIDTQTRELLNMLITVALLGGLWAIWGGALPLLDVIGNRPLWTYTTTLDGKPVTASVTVGGLLLALLVLFVTTVATKNVGGMLDIILLRRLELQADANYAIKTIARYVIVGVGAVMASNLVGIDWSKAQWLVAALGVGLGFGLQEIVANFVSGLIVLGERPIRIGDVVTVGNVSGTVSRIRARATMVTDFENKEVLIPNKAFITERVVNWTLSSGVTRLLLPVGVAYGTDPEKVQKLLLDIVRAHPDVLSEPAPSVFFTAFGPSSLDFEIRVFVDGTSKRLPTQHDINVAITRRFAENGIEIPFPQQDVHLRSIEGLREQLVPRREARLRPMA